MIRFLHKSGLHELEGTDIACPWYALGIMLAGRYGLKDSQTIANFGVSLFDHLKGIKQVAVPEGTFHVSGSTPPGVN